MGEKMGKYNICFTFDGNNSLDEIVIRVLLREINNLKNSKTASKSCMNDYTFREYE